MRAENLSWPTIVLALLVAVSSAQGAGAVDDEKRTQEPTKQQQLDNPTGHRAPPARKEPQTFVPKNRMTSDQAVAFPTGI
jgi:hypothetical protein